MPTKDRAGDLMQACTAATARPRCPSSRLRPGDCFQTAIEACRMALTHMIRGAALGRLHRQQRRALAGAGHGVAGQDPVKFQTRRTASRPTRATRTWRAPGRCPAPPASSTASAASRSSTSRATSATTRKHEFMCKMRQDRVQKIGTACATEIYGDAEGDLLVLGWGNTTARCARAWSALRASGQKDRPRPVALDQPVPERSG